jgi:hypothetical protein
MRFLVCTLPHSASGKVHQELAQGFPSFLSPPPQRERATAPAVGQGLKTQQRPRPGALFFLLLLLLQD